mmetsp:Transcript_20924/g.45434  ORF Transcript_20924/g.45434 Transcript_20924/m.45434 type:complete len:396 (+) Transcript_20924:87-1274(+)
MWGAGGFMMPGAGGYAPRKFEEQYHCYSVAYCDKAHMEKGDKILLPPSAFDTLARLQVDYPMLFKLTSMGSDGRERRTHCGVLEFTAEEGCVYIPFWMMQNLLIEEGSLLTVTNVSLPKATFVKLQPQSVDFLEISNPRAVLEHALRNFSCVTVGDIIQIPYNNKNYHFALQDVKPNPAACIIETDCNVDFDAPVGYQEPTRSANSSNRPSACPSPVSTASSVPNSLNPGGEAEEEDSKPPGIRIVDGKIVRPGEAATTSTTSEMLAEKTGQTGVQRNSAVPAEAPTVDYWAVNAGDGSRLDGKAAQQLKDAQGNVVDVRALRAEAAARRAGELEKQQAGLKRMEGKTVAGEAAAPEAPKAAPAMVSKRKPRVGNKYSRLKNSGHAFQGSANSFK